MAIINLASNHSSTLSFQKFWESVKEQVFDKESINYFFREHLLPPYSPELNATEHLWDYIRSLCTFNWMLPP